MIQKRMKLDHLEWMVAAKRKMVEIEFIDITELDPSINDIDTIFETFVALIEKANLTTEKKVVVVTSEKAEKYIDASLDFNEAIRKTNKIPHYWLSEINFTPKIDTIEKYFINKNNFQSKKEFVESYFKWIKENCYNNKKEWIAFDGSKREYEHTTEDKYEGVFAIYIYEF